MCLPGYRDRQPAGKTWPCTHGARCQKFAGAGTRNEFRLQPEPIKHHAWHQAGQPGARQPPGARSAGSWLRVLGCRDVGEPQHDDLGGCSRLPIADLVMASVLQAA